ncbi:MAG TPA: GAF domain-containing protein [Bryobacteraceae bacterium]|nr:GAF domain-containing protein [Bryobacteraceae bacterium]
MCARITHLEVCESRPEVFAALRENLARAVPYQVLVVYRRRGNSLEPEYLDGEGRDGFSSVEVRIGEGLAGWVAGNGLAVVNGNPSVETGYLEDPASSGALRSALAVPLESPSGVEGVLSLYRRERRSIGEPHPPAELEGHPLAGVGDVPGDRQFGLRRLGQAVHADEDSLGQVADGLGRLVGHDQGVECPGLAVQREPQLGGGQACGSHGQDQKQARQAVHME